MPPATNAPTGSIAGTVTNANERAAGERDRRRRRAHVGHVVQLLRAEADANGSYKITGVPEGDYPRLNFTFDGFDPVSRGPAMGDPPLKVLAGQTTTRSAVLRRDWASLRGGVAFGTIMTSTRTSGRRAARCDRPVAGTGWSLDNTGAAPFLILRLPQAVTVSDVRRRSEIHVRRRRRGFDPPSAGRTSTTTDANCNGTFVTARTMTFGSNAWGTLNEFTPLAGTASARCVRLTLQSSFIDGSDFRDLSEFGVYTAPLPRSQPPPTRRRPRCRPRPRSLRSRRPRCRGRRRRPRRSPR